MFGISYEYVWQQVNILAICQELRRMPSTVLCGMMFGSILRRQTWPDHDNLLCLTVDNKSSWRAARTLTCWHKYSFVLCSLYDMLSQASYPRVAFVINCHNFQVWHTYSMQIEAFVTWHSEHSLIKLQRLIFSFMDLNRNHWIHFKFQTRYALSGHQSNNSFQNTKHGLFLSVLA